MKASELRAKDVDGLKKEVADLLKAARVEQLAREEAEKAKNA